MSLLKINKRAGRVARRALDCTARLPRSRNNAIFRTYRVSENILNDSNAIFSIGYQSVVLVVKVDSLYK